MGKNNIFTRLATYLLSMTLISNCLLSNMYARYVSTHVMDDATHVVGFGDVIINKRGIFNEKNTIFAPGASLYGNVNIDFEGSDISTYMFLEIILSENWKIEDSYNVVIKSNDVQLMNTTISNSWIYLKQQNNVVVYYQEINPNTNFNQNVFSANAINVSSLITSEHFDLLEDISMQFKAHVIQSNGFETVDLAWETIKD